MSQSILVTGGTGHIGSHAAVELLAADQDVFITDNFCNSEASVLDRIERMAGRRPRFARADLRDRPALRKLFTAHSFDAVIHFAGSRLSENRRKNRFGITTITAQEASRSSNA
jgi:UDP-glucose 4-epimerase